MPGCYPSELPDTRSAPSTRGGPPLPNWTPCSTPPSRGSVLTSSEVRTMPADLTGRICVVTGANRGIGRATAAGLAELGASLVLVCRRLEDGQAVSRDIAARGWL